MATNDFVPVAPGPGANVASQATYLADPVVTTGNVSGVAKSAIVNKSLRQGTVIAAVVAQYIADVTGQNSVDDGTTATLLANLKAALRGKLIRTTVYTKNAGVQSVSVDGAAPTTVGATTFTSLSTTTKVGIRMAGGGGAGGGTVLMGATSYGAGGGGGGAAYVEALLTSGFSGGVSVTCGAGGAGVNGATGNSGTSSSFGALITANGGVGGNAATNSATNSTSAGGAGGIGTGSMLFQGQGQAGLPSVCFGNGDMVSGAGGGTPFGGGGTPVISSNNFGNAGQAFGAGGSGAASQNNTGPNGGGAGGNGIIIIEEYSA